MLTDMDLQFTLTEALTEISHLSAFESSAESKSWTPSITHLRQPTSLPTGKAWDAGSSATTCNDSSLAGTPSSMCLSMEDREQRELAESAEASPGARFGAIARRQVASDEAGTDDALLQLLDMRRSFCFGKEQAAVSTEPSSGCLSGASRAPCTDSRAARKRDRKHVGDPEQAPQAPVPRDALDGVLMQKTLASLAGPVLPLAASRQGTPKSFSVDSRVATPGSSAGVAGTDRTLQRSRTFAGIGRSIFQGPEPRRFLEPLGHRVADCPVAGAPEGAVGSCCLGLCRAPEMARLKEHLMQLHMLTIQRQLQIMLSIERDIEIKWSALSMKVKAPEECSRQIRAYLNFRDRLRPYLLEEDLVGGKQARDLQTESGMSLETKDLAGVRQGVTEVLKKLKQRYQWKPNMTSRVEISRVNWVARLSAMIRLAMKTSCLFADQELRQLLREDEKRKLGKEVFDQYRQWYKLERGDGMAIKGVKVAPPDVVAKIRKKYEEGPCWAKGLELFSLRHETAKGGMTPGLNPGTPGLAGNLTPGGNRTPFQMPEYASGHEKSEGNTPQWKPPETPMGCAAQDPSPRSGTPQFQARASGTPAGPPPLTPAQGVKGSMTPPGPAGPAASTPNINPFTPGQGPGGSGAPPLTPGAPPRTPSNLPGSANAPTTPVVFEQRCSSSLLIATEAEGEQADVQPAPPPPQLGVYELHQQDAREILYQALRAQPLSMPSEATVSQHRVSSRQSDVVNF
eukprot:s4528_g5.t1